MSDEEQTEKVLALLDRARKHWEENPPPPPSDAAAAMARKYVKIPATRVRTRR